MPKPKARRLMLIQEATPAVSQMFAKKLLGEKGRIVEPFSGGPHGPRDSARAFLPLGKKFSYTGIEKGWPEVGRKLMREEEKELKKKVKDLAKWEVKEDDVYKRGDLIKKADLVYLKNVWGFTHDPMEKSEELTGLLKHVNANKRKDAHFMIYEESGVKAAEGLPPLGQRAEDIHKALEQMGEHKLYAVLQKKASSEIKLTQYDGKSNVKHWLLDVRDGIERDSLGTPLYMVNGVVGLGGVSAEKVKNLFKKGTLK